MVSSSEFVGRCVGARPAGPPRKGLRWGGRCKAAGRQAWKGDGEPYRRRYRSKWGREGRGEERERQRRMRVVGRRKGRQRAAMGSFEEKNERMHWARAGRGGCRTRARTTMRDETDGGGSNAAARGYVLPRTHVRRRAPGASGVSIAAGQDEMRPGRNWQNVCRGGAR